MQLIKYQQIIDQQKEKIQSLNDRYNTAEVKNLEQVRQLQTSKAKEVTMMEKHFKEKLDQDYKFIEELKNDKINLLKDKEAHTKRIADLERLTKEQERKVDEN